MDAMACNVAFELYAFGNLEEMHTLRYNILKFRRQKMYFERKAYTRLLDWKEKYAEKYAVLLEGARQAIKHLVADIRVTLPYNISALYCLSLRQVRRADR